ncbi:MAG: PilZ domain-containing protein [Sphingomonas bacterium]|nr:PilZ domain-containing protein [Sphingomonas bacterium]
MNGQQVETTLYSLSVAAPAPAERRDSERLMTLYRVGSLSIGDRRELCLIKNISAGGMMVRAYCNIPTSTRLSVELKCGQPIDGSVSWVRESNIGIVFDQPVDVIDILATSLHGPRPRMPRIEVFSLVTVRDGAMTYRLKTCDISQGGLKVQGETIIAPGSDVVITLPGLEPLRGVIRWAEGGQIGLTFNRMLNLTLLVEWLQRQREAVRTLG